MNFIDNIIMNYKLQEYLIDSARLLQKQKFEVIQHLLIIVKHLWLHLYILSVIPLDRMERVSVQPTFFFKNPIHKIKIFK